MITKNLGTRLRRGVAAASLPLLMAGPAFAGGTVDPLNGLKKVGGEAGYGETAPGLPETVGKLINAALGLLGIVMVVLTIYAGFLWMTAGGNEEKVTKAKKMLTNAVIGLVIVMAAYSIATFVVGSIVNGTQGTT